MSDNNPDLESQPPPPNPRITFSPTTVPPTSPPPLTSTSPTEGSTSVESKPTPLQNYEKLGIDEKVGLGKRGGIGLERSLTKEDKELAEAGYQHLKGAKKEKGDAKGKGAEGGESSDISEHGLTLEELSKKSGCVFSTNPSVNPASLSKGLSSDEAAARLARDGPNKLTPPKKKSALMKYLECLGSLFNILLIVAGILEYVLLGIDFSDNHQNEYLGGILIAVAFLNAFIEWYQIQKSEAILASFLAMIPPNSTVVRDGGMIKTVKAEELVDGDLVIVKMGDKVPADLVVIWAVDCKVDNSSLTGESEPQERAPLIGGSTSRAVEATNLLFNSTLVVSGEAWGIVVRTGDHTFIGQIASLTGQESGNKSPLAVEIDRFVMIISAIAIISAIIFFIVGIETSYKGKANQTVTFAVSILVAWVPEGLPATVTLLLSIAAKRMAAQNVLVKDLQGVETLGALTLLATDKTGTLTRNQMTVTNLWSSLLMYSSFHSQNDTDSVKPFAITEPGMEELVMNCALNSKVRFNRVDIEFEEREILADATEAGLTRFAGRILKGGKWGGYDQVKETYPKVFEIPFNSDNKWALVVVNKPHEHGELTTYIKGAPERVLGRCTSYLSADGTQLPISEEIKKKYDEAYSYMASRGHRVIACGQMLLGSEKFPADFKFSKTEGNCPTEGFCFVGLISLEDPPKHGVREAIGKLRQAGIKVMMVTGDHPKTAAAIARKVNLIIGETKESLSEKTGRPIEEIHDDEVDAVVVHGDKIDSLEGWEWDQIMRKNEIVFARTSPKHKLEIVKHAQALGHVVGVTGDGVNDSPALKKADLGIAMNISGSDVSKEAANMILLDDNFASVVQGVTEGRLIFANLKRSIQYTVTHSMPEVVPQLLYVVVPIPLPLSAILILVIDLGFELFAALSFAWDKPESPEALMKLQPRKPVNEVSIATLKRKAFRRTKTYRYDEETGEKVEPGRVEKFKTWIRKPFTKVFWEDQFEKDDNETLVDGKLLSYSYLEAGVIETIGALVSYFVIFYHMGFTPKDLYRIQKASTHLNSNNYFTHSGPDYTNTRGRVITGSEQADALAQAQSIMYLSIFILQCFNMFAVKAKFKPPFGKQIVGNYWNFAGILAGACLAMFIIYTPPLHTVFGGSHHLSPLYWLVPMGFGGLLLVWATIRVVLNRRAIESQTVKPIRGLAMFPTKRTLSLGRTNTFKK